MEDWSLSFYRGMALLVAASPCALAMDETGTLTEGRPRVTALVSAAGVDDRELLRLTGAVERQSQHPLAEAVVRRAQEKEIELPEGVRWRV